MLGDKIRVGNVETESVFDQVGGLSWFIKLVDIFYDSVETDEPLRAMYPQDLTGPRKHTALFLAQYWGGPTTYSDERGHPRLRMRHAGFKIDQTMRDAWLEHMLDALKDSSPPGDIEQRMADYFAMAATHMINSET